MYPSILLSMIRWERGVYYDQSLADSYLKGVAIVKIRWHSFAPVLLAFLLVGLAVACRSPSNSGAKQHTSQADSTPPLIEDINVPVITSWSAAVTCLTDEEASCQVRYGRTARELGQQSEKDEPTKVHSITLTKLDANTEYFYAVTAVDASGNEATSDIHTFKTLLKIGCDVGNIAPDFTLRNLRGIEVTLSSYRGRVVVVYFWYLACRYCTTEMSYLQEAFDIWSSSNGPVLLVVNTKDAFNDVHRWMMDKPYTFTVLIDEQKALAKKYCLFGWPTTIVISPDGIIKKVKTGASGGRKEIEEITRSL